jgi:hypothetical protein
VEVLKKVSTLVEIKLYLKALRKRRPLHPRLLPKQLKLKNNLQLQEVLQSKLSASQLQQRIKFLKKTVQKILKTL